MAAPASGSETGSFHPIGHHDPSLKPANGGFAYFAIDGPLAFHSLRAIPCQT